MQISIIILCSSGREVTQGLSSSRRAFCFSSAISSMNTDLARWADKKLSLSDHSRFKGCVIPGNPFPHILHPCKTEPPKIPGHFLVSQPSTTITPGCTWASSISQWELELVPNDSKNQDLTASTVSHSGRGQSRWLSALLCHQWNRGVKSQLHLKYAWMYYLFDGQVSPLNLPNEENKSFKGMNTSAFTQL